jgi:hypothetical protein
MVAELVLAGKPMEEPIQIVTAAAETPAGLDHNSGHLTGTLGLFRPKGA